MKSTCKLRPSSLAAILMLVAAMPGCDETTPVSPLPPRGNEPSLGVYHVTDQNGTNYVTGSSVKLENGRVVFRAFSRCDREVWMELLVIAGTGQAEIEDRQEVVGYEVKKEFSVPGVPGTHYWIDTRHGFVYALPDGTQWGGWWMSYEELVFLEA